MKIFQYKYLIKVGLLSILSILLASVKINAQTMGIEQTISDRAQQQTIAFDGVAFMTGDFCSCTFLPPGKVADFCGFQYLRDNDPTQLGHNTDFVTIIAYNILNMLDSNQFKSFRTLATQEINLTSAYVVNRFPLIKAFRRMYDNDMPTHAIGLNKDSVLEWSASKIYAIDGQISFMRSKVMGEVIRNLSTKQRNLLDSLKNLNGVGHWPTSLPDPMKGLGLSPAISVLVMTYASEMYAWYAGNNAASTYFCPERQGTYFGSFYMKDIRAMGNPGYYISPNMTDSVGRVFLDTILNTTQRSIITSIVDSQRTSLLKLVDIRDSISGILRNFMTTSNVDSNLVISLSKEYGRLDGYISYLYAIKFTEVGHSCNSDQQKALMHLRNLDTFQCRGSYLYSEPSGTPNIPNTDFFFTIANSVNEKSVTNSKLIYPNPFSDYIQMSGATGNEEYELRDFTGKLIWNGKSISTQNFESLQTGVYFIKIVDNTNVSTFKLIKK